MIRWLPTNTGTITHGDFDKQSNSLANALLAKGLSAGR